MSTQEDEDPMWYAGVCRSVRSEATAQASHLLIHGDREVGGENRSVNQAGYTKAVDMWSIGCVTTALLAGKSYFVNTQDSGYERNPSAAIIQAAAECDLDRLDYSSAWLGIDLKAKCFVKRLLVLDEKARMTAELALRHLWFTEGFKGSSMVEIYEDTIAGWEPWSPGWDFAEHLNRFIEARISQSDVM